MVEAAGVGPSPQNKHLITNVINRLYLDLARLKGQNRDKI